MHSLTQVVLQEREILVRQKEERSICLGFTLLWLSSILRKFCGVLSLVGFLEEDICVLCVTMLFVLSVILLVKIILRYHLSN